MSPLIGFAIPAYRVLPICRPHRATYVSPLQGFVIPCYRVLPICRPDGVSSYPVIVFSTDGVCPDRVPTNMLSRFADSCPDQGFAIPCSITFSTDMSPRCGFVIPCIVFYRYVSPIRVRQQASSRSTDMSARWGPPLPCYHVFYRYVTPMRFRHTLLSCSTDLCASMGLYLDNTHRNNMLLTPSG